MAKSTAYYALCELVLSYVATAKMSTHYSHTLVLYWGQMSGLFYLDVKVANLNEHHIIT